MTDKKILGSVEITGVLNPNDSGLGLSLPDTSSFSETGKTLATVEDENTKLSSKVDKLTSGNKVYIHNGSTQTDLTYTKDATADTIVERSTGGNIVLPAIDSSTGTDNYAISQKYSDTHYTPLGRTIAGVDLQDNVSKSEMLTALNVADGSQVNVLEGIKVNGTAQTPTNKVVNISVPLISAEDYTITVQ